MIEGFIRGLRQPEYVHVLLNPLPVYGLLISWLGLIAAVISKNRRAQIVTLILVFMTSISAWPVFEFGQQGYDRVLAMTDDDGHAWLDEHEARAERVIYIFYALAALSVTGIIAPLRWPKSSAPLALVVVWHNRLVTSRDSSTPLCSAQDDVQKSGSGLQFFTLCLWQPNSIAQNTTLHNTASR